MTVVSGSMTNRGWRAIAIYALVLLAIVGAGGAALSLAFSTAGAGRAISLSGAVVLVVQLGGFIALRGLGSGRVMVGWGMLAILRVVTMVLFAVLVARLMHPGLVPGLVSMATFFFLSTL